MILAILTIEDSPGCFDNSLNACFAPKKIEVAVIAIVLSYPANGISSTRCAGPEIPALPTKQVNLPKVSTANWIAFGQSSSLATSRCTYAAWPPLFLISSTTAWPAWSFTSATTAAVPSLANPIAVAPVLFYFGSWMKQRKQTANSTSCEIYSTALGFRTNDSPAPVTIATRSDLLIFIGRIWYEMVERARG